MAKGNDNPALWIIEEDGSEAKLSFAEMSARSNRVANWLRKQGVKRGERILIMLGNEVPLWETMLAAIKLGAVVIPATTLLTPEDLDDRIGRGQGGAIFGLPGGGALPGHHHNPKDTLPTRTNRCRPCLTNKRSSC